MTKRMMHSSATRFRRSLFTQIATMSTRTVVNLLALLSVASTTPAAAQAGTRRADDSTAVAIRHDVDRAIRDSIRAAGITKPNGLVVIALYQDLSGGEVRVFDSNVPEQLIGGVVKRMLPRIGMWPERQPVRILVRLDPLPAPDPAAGESAKDTPPEFLNRDEISSILDQFASENLRGVRGLSIETTLSLVVARDGTVIYGIIDDPTGANWMDALAAYVAARLRFRAAVMKGTPADVWVRLPIRVGTR